MPFPYLKMSIARSDITIDDMAASGHGSAVSLPQNVDRPLDSNHPRINRRDTAVPFPDFG